MYGSNRNEEFMNQRRRAVKLPIESHERQWVIVGPYLINSNTLSSHMYEHITHIHVDTSQCIPKSHTP